MWSRLHVGEAFPLCYPCSLFPWQIYGLCAGVLEEEFNIGIHTVPRGAPMPHVVWRKEDAGRWPGVAERRAAVLDSRWAFDEYGLVHFPIDADKHVPDQTIFSVDEFSVFFHREPPEELRAWFALGAGPARVERRAVELMSPTDKEVDEIFEAIKDFRLRGGTDTAKLLEDLERIKEKNKPKEEKRCP
jgi:hypothetical protein